MRQNRIVNGKEYSVFVEREGLYFPEGAALGVYRNSDQEFVHRRTGCAEPEEDLWKEGWRYAEADAK